MLNFMSKVMVKNNFYSDVSSIIIGKKGHLEPILKIHWSYAEISNYQWGLKKITLPFQMVKMSLIEAQKIYRIEFW